MGEEKKGGGFNKASRKDSKEGKKRRKGTVNPLQKAYSTFVGKEARLLA